MKTKKFMSLVLALVMALSLAVPAFATATPTLDNTEVTDMAKINTATTTVNGTYQAPILALTVPKKINLLLNPYGVAVTTNKDTAIQQDDVQSQIVSADNLIISRSNVPIDIKATATATIASAEGGAWTLAQTAPAADSVKKEAYVYMVFGDVTTTDIDTADEVTDFILTAPANNKKPYQGITYANISYPQNPNLTAPSAATDKRDGIILKAGEGKETTLNQSLGECQVEEGATAGTYVYKSANAVAFKLDGAMVANPKDSAWGKDDKLTVSVAWKFVPGSQASSTGNGGVAQADYTGTGTFSLANAAAVELNAALTNQSSTTTTVTLSNVTGVATASNVTYGSGKVTVAANTAELTGATAGDTVVVSGTINYTDDTETAATKTFQITISVTA